MMANKAIAKIFMGHFHGKLMLAKFSRVLSIVQCLFNDKHLILFYNRNRRIAF